MSKEKRGFNYKLYALIAFILVAAILAASTVITFKNKYLAFHPDTIAANYVDTIAQKGDGYNAYKYTLASKSEKYGDFVRKYYMYKLIYPGYEPEMSDDEFDELKKNGLDTDSHKSEKTIDDDGTLAGQLSDAMYPYYVELIKTYGWDNYDAVYNNYFEKLIEERKAIFGDDYLSDEVMFSALEANVAAYGNAVTGTEKELTDDGKTVVQEESIGLYQTIYGKNYKLSTNVKSIEPVEDIEAYKASLNASALETYGISADDISEADKVVTQVTVDGKKNIAEIEVTVAKIGNTWYIDNISTDTSSLYSLQSDLSA